MSVCNQFLDRAVFSFNCYRKKLVPLLKLIRLVDRFLFVLLCPLHILSVRLLAEMAEFDAEGVQTNDHHGRHGWHRVHVALAEADRKSVQEQLDSGVDVDTRSRTAIPFTPLHLAVEWGYLITVKLLVERKADVNKCDSVGKRALQIACMCGNAKVIELLLDCKANVNAADIHCVTPMIEAVHQFSDPIVQLLIEHKADLLAQDNGGQTVMDRASHFWNPAMAESLQKSLKFGSSLD